MVDLREAHGAALIPVGEQSVIARLCALSYGLRHERKRDGEHLGVTLDAACHSADDRDI